MIISMINNLIFVTFALFQKDQILSYIYQIFHRKNKIYHLQYWIHHPKNIYATPNTPNLQMVILFCLMWICVISGKHFQCIDAFLRNKMWGNLSFVKITSSTLCYFGQTFAVHVFARNRWKVTSSSGRDFSSSSALILIHLSASCNKTSHGLISLTSLGKWDIEKSRKVVSDHYRRKVV